MKTKFIDEEIKYIGSQLAPHWIYKNFKIQGDSIVAFVGECEVKLTEMVDIEDVIAKEDIVEDVILKLHPMAYDYYINELSQKELSAKYNLSQAYISRIISKNINRIRTQMFMDEFIDNKGEIL